MQKVKNYCIETKKNILANCTLYFLNVNNLKAHTVTTGRDKWFFSCLKEIINASKQC